MAMILPGQRQDYRKRHGSKTPSINAVPDEAVIYIDHAHDLWRNRGRSHPPGRSLNPEESKDRVSVEPLFYDEPSYTGFVFPVEKYFPAWVMPDHDLVKAGLKAREMIGFEPAPAGNGPSVPMAFTGRARPEYPQLALGPAMK